LVSDHCDVIGYNSGVFEGYFPFDVIRPEQREAIEFVLDAFLNHDKKFVILQMGTGTGKSAVAVTIARYLDSLMSSSRLGTYVLTPQKLLQDQYIRDFGPGARDLIRSIKSSSNYTCRHYSDQSCAESRRILSKFSKFLAGSTFHQTCAGNCPYSLDKKAFLESKIGVTNFSYFFAETTYAGKICPRQLLIVDECHNIESELSNFVEITFSENFALHVLKCGFPLVDPSVRTVSRNVFAWIKGTYRQALIKFISRLEKVLKTKFKTSDGFAKYSKQYELLDKHLCKVNRFIEVFKSDNWIINTIVPRPGTRQKRKLELKPIDVAPYGSDMLYRFGERVLMMSATVIDVDVFCKSVGIDRDRVSYKEIPSPFDSNNRPIHIMPVGSMSKTYIDQTLPKMVNVIKEILNQHTAEKGIIHCFTFKTAKYLVDTIKCSRLLIHESNNREEIMQYHLKSKDPTVLVSPSMAEGIDLYDDFSRFQVVCKIPFPYLGDEVVRQRMKRDPKWYAYQTTKMLIQSLGRSVRHCSDFAVSYVLDADWKRFYDENREMFPREFVAALR